MNNFDYKNMTPFKWFVLENFPFIENDFDAINNYHLFSKVVEYLNKTIDNMNLTGEQMENVTNAMTELQNYVNNYFNNLDVQEEINNKLDEMATNGTLYNIMQPYFNNVQEQLNQFENETNGKITVIENRVNSIASGSPLPANTISEMTDTTRMYVLLTTGYLYYYNGTEWVNSNILYQSATADKYLLPDSINSVENKVITKNIKYVENNSQSKFIKFLQSNLNLNYNKGLPLRFFRSAYTNSYNYSDTSNRGCTDKFSLDGKLYIINFGKIRYNLFKLDKTTGEILERAKTNYATIPYLEYEVSSDYDYIFIITNLTEETNTLTDENIKLAEENLVVMLEPLNENDITKITKKSQLFEDIIDGYYIESVNGRITENANMCYCEYKNILPRTKLYWNNCYTQFAFYDINKNYISGMNYNPVATAPTKPFNEIDVPNYAFYIRISTRKANKNRLIISEIPFALNNYNENMLYSVLPKNQIKDNKNQIMYNLDFKNGVRPDELTVNSTSFIDDGLSISYNGYARYNLFTCIDKSINKFRFKTDNNSILRFGYDITPYTNMSDGCLIVEINTQTKIMNVYRGTYSNLNNKSLIGTSEIPFDFDNTSEYCIKISKETIYKLNIELFNSTCPNEICTSIIESETNVCRCWGGGRADCVSGILTLVNMSFISTGEKYPKLFIIGDSYVENYSRTYNSSYARQLYNILDGKVFLSGQGGASSRSILKRYANSGTLAFAEYTIFNTGVNDRNITFEQYQENMNNLINYCKNLNSIPILVTCPRVMDTDNLAIMRQINTFVRNSGYKYIDLAYALSTGDGETQDENKYQNDKIHPNENGANAIIKWIEANLPELIY